MSGRLTDLSRNRLANVAKKLDWTFIKTHHRFARIVRSGVKVQEMLHSCDVLAAHFRDAPFAAKPGLDFLFFKTRRMVSSDIESTRPSDTIWSASSCMTQWDRPAGGLLHAKATKWASARPCSFAGRPARASSCKQSSLRSRKRLRVMATVSRLTRTISAIAASVLPSSASNKVCARRMVRAPDVPVVTISNSLDLSSASNTTVDLLSICLSLVFGNFRKYTTGAPAFISVVEY